MENKLNKKSEAFQVEFKNSVKKWLEERNASIKSNNNDVTSDFIKFMYDSNGLVFTNDDFQKRKRVKNEVPINNRCIAKRANNEQCTRSKKDDNNLCGTHIKGTPYGVFNNEVLEVKSVAKIEISVKEIKGINFYIDDMNNVYKPEDIIHGKQQPTIIAKWTLGTDGNYHIPSLNV
jgi:hypothetical protein